MEGSLSLAVLTKSIEVIFFMMNSEKLMYYKSSSHFFGKNCSNGIEILTSRQLTASLVLNKWSTVKFIMVKILGQIGLSKQCRSRSGSGSLLFVIQAPSLRCFTILQKKQQKKNVKLLGIMSVRILFNLSGNISFNNVFTAQFS